MTREPHIPRVEREIERKWTLLLIHFWIVLNFATWDIIFFYKIPRLQQIFIICYLKILCIYIFFFLVLYEDKSSWILWLNLITFAATPTPTTRNVTHFETYKIKLPVPLQWVNFSSYTASDKTGKVYIHKKIKYDVKNVPLPVT